LLIVPDNFIIRQPLGSFNEYKEFFLNMDLSLEDQFDFVLEFFASNELLQEAILVANRNFYDVIIKKINDNTITLKEKRNILKTLVNYIIRYTTKPTPYGLFAGIGEGQFTNTKDVIISIGECEKYVRPDMEWLFGVCKIIENDLFNDLIILKNPSLLITETEIFIPYSSKWGLNLKGAILNPFSIKRNKITDFIFETVLGEEGEINVSKLLIKMTNEFPEIQYEICHQLVKKLLNNDFLISSIRPPLIENPLSFILKSLKKVNHHDKWINKLNDVNFYLEQYQKKEIGTGKEEFLIVEKKMNSINHGSNNISIDSKTNSNIKISKEVKNEIRTLVEFLYKLPVQKKNPNLEKFKQEFINEYSEYTEIPIIDLFNSRLSKYYSSNQNVEKKFNIPNLLYQKISEAVYKGHYEVVITKEMVREYESDMNRAVNTLELNFTVGITESNENFLILNKSSSNKFGKSYLRYQYFLKDSPIYQELAKCYEDESQSDVVFCEVNFLPPGGRSANVQLYSNPYPCELVLNTNLTGEDKLKLTIDDIVVGWSKKRNNFYFKSRALNREILPQFNNLVGVNGLPKVIKFMKEVISDRQGINTLEFGDVSNFSFLPRIRIGSLILFPAQWTLDISRFKLLKDINEWNLIFLKWVKDFSLPQYVYMITKGSRILVDIKSNGQRDFIFQHMKKVQENTIKFMESTITEKTKYITEIIIPVINPEENKSNLTFELSTKTKYVPRENKVRLIGESWFYFKIYLDYPNVEHFFNELYTMKQKHKALFNSFFFIRFADPHFHIRLRIYKSDSHFIQNYLPVLLEWLKELSLRKIITNYKLENYVPEVERYGGEALISLIEDIFFEDSNMVLDWLRKSSEKDITNEEFAVINILQILKDFKLDLKDQFNLFNKNNKLKGFYEDSKKFYLDNKKSKLVSLNNIRSEKISKFSVEYSEIYNTDNTLLYSIIDSLLHLHCNRVGLDKSAELKVRTITSNYLKYVINNNNL